MNTRRPSGHPVARLARGVAENIGPQTLRTLDAPHLAAAFATGDVLTAFVTYGKRLLDAAVLTGLPVVTPGTD